MSEQLGSTARTDWRRTESYDTQFAEALTTVITTAITVAKCRADPPSESRAHLWFP